MGVRVASQGPGKHIMACAHRYQQKCPLADNTCVVLTGQCYLLGDDLRVGTEEGDSRRVVCDEEHLDKRPIDHSWFAYCQQGHGASFAKDDKSLLFGAPGAYNWKGIVRMEPLDFLTDLYSEDRRETGDVRAFDSKLIPLQINSYLGFSIDSGLALIRKGELTIVSGAPRGGYSGQVTFLKADPVAKQNVSVELVLSGPGLASSFGYDVAVVDLNSDGWEDLAVGAPQFFVKDSLVGGAVYVYINNGGKNWEKIVPTQLLGPKESMFGLAVENIGDANQDGYGDIAVGAPYDGSGRVYLYYGSSAGIHKKVAQVLSPGSKTVSLFGYSLSGNLDVDDNQYPDLAVGSLSDSVFVYRARPVVSVSSSLRVTPGVIDLTKEQCHLRTCYFSVRACFTYTYTSHAASLNLKLVLNYTFEADAGRRKPRVEFQGSFKGKLELPEQGREICTDARLRLRREIKDMLLSIPVSVSVSLWSSGQTSRTRAGPSNVTPVLNHFQQKRTDSEIVLVNEGCGRDNICQSNMKLQYKFCSRNTTQNNQDVFKSLAGEDGVAVLTPSDEDVALEVTVTNKGGDDAHQPHCVIHLPDSLRYSSVVPSTTADTQTSCTVNEKGTRINCELGNPFHRDAEVTFYVMLAKSRIHLSTKEVSVSVQLKTTSVQTIQPVESSAKVLFELDLQLLGIARPSEVSLGKSSKGERDIKSVDDIGAPVQYEFRIANLGRPLKSFINASLNIYWPKENSAGKWLLYLTQSNSTGVHSVPCSPAGEVNPFKDSKGWREPSRRRREAEPVRSSLLPKEYRVLTCSDGLRCVELRCPLLGLDITAKIVLHSRLWSATFTEDYSSLNYLHIITDASLSLTNAPENIGLKPEVHLTKVKLTVFLEGRFRFLVKVAWWIIFLTVIALLLILAVFVFLLWKRGSFKCLPQNKKLSTE
ncbi:integrin alpha-6-like [Sparus aurata]|uniref:integrin alpha-6-like n=1 Tax=Sparus aurata TaxID=8175 RepID=UPI0011C14632|nr:integrin alpha-6-like [Sparus aurata]